MTDALLPTLLQEGLQAGLQALLRQTALLSMIVLVLLALRRPLARHVGPGFAYVAWAVLPLLLIVDLLPASPPATQFSAEFVRQIAPALGQATAPSLQVLAPTSSAPLWLMLWAVGALVVVARMAWLQRRFSMQGPALVGLWPPRLVLPQDFEQRFDAAQRPLVLAHEEVHRRRFDNHWNALAAALCVLHWFNPLAWLALRAMRADQELSCDHAVMRRHPGREADYGRALLRAQQSLSPLQPWSGWRSSHPLIERVAMLAVRPRSRSRRLLGASALAVLTLGAAGAVHAVNAVMPELARDPIPLELYVEVNRRDGTPPTDKRVSKMRLVTEEGKRALVVLGGRPDQPTPDQVRVEITAKRRNDRQLTMTFSVTEGGQPLMNNTVLVKEGVEATVWSAPDDLKQSEVLIRVRSITLAEVPGYKPRQ
ncbi:M56 family metallopeptidase [Roseateles noduli]|uniref:M56 family metallopeptidase n=1 Tax=Roseateles noduli TaxID=2052484 RepID=UPI003D64CFCD